MTFRNFLLFLVVATATVVTATTPDFPRDAAGQERLWNETIQAILEFKKEFDAHPELYQAEDGDALLTVPEIIARYGYPWEAHNVTTEDGYILQLHRIPYGLGCGEGAGKRVAYLQHGLMGDSSNWIITGNKSRGLAFELVDACYDVWMGNYRGNTYSRLHTDPNKADFYDFSWHEMGMYDIPASIDYILTATSAPSLYYVGHSMGCTAFFVAMSERPEYNAKVKLMSALAPATFMPNTKSLVVRLLLGLMPIFDRPPYMLVLPIEWTERLAAALCKTGSPTQPLCAMILFLIGGDNAPQLDLVSLPAILGHSPAGSSSKTFLHYGQSILSGEFRKYDYGAEKNPEHYDGALTPPAYDLKKITTKIAIYYGPNDFLADRVDVIRSVREFGNGTVVNLREIEDPLFNHLDFVWAKDQHKLVNEVVMDFMEEFTNPTPTTTAPSGGITLGGGGVAMWVVVLLVTGFWGMKSSI
ncbi:lipase 3 [Folsomia candida]|uniref:lipase 3 n=1 Tax=Folsomia candida TaxID=158441 RepID=UPI000B8F6FCD|nr:lipase 3 [Folsomia candida]